MIDAAIHPMGETIAASVEELTATVKQTTGNAAQARDLSSAAAQSAAQEIGVIEPHGLFLGESMRELSRTRDIQQTGFKLRILYGREQSRGGHGRASWVGACGPVHLGFRCW